VPEARRGLRHRLRTRLSWAGFGSPEPGTWIAPSVAREAEAREIIAELGLDGQAMSFTARFAGIGDERAMAERAWNLAAVAGRYEEFIATFGGLRPAGPDDVLQAQARLVHEWRRFPFLDPQLPRPLLPANWSGSKAAALFHHKHGQWQPAAAQRWDEMAAARRP
jgi:phenylacetic acid degradation operon negative regulatory protein